MVKQISKNENILFRRIHLFKVQLSLGGRELLLEQVWYRVLEGGSLIYVSNTCLFKKHSQCLYLIPQVLHFSSSCLYLNLILWMRSARWLARFENDLALNLALLASCSLIFFYIFASFLNFFLYWKWKSYAFFSIFT